MKDARGHGSNGRGSTAPAPAYDGKPTWHGITATGKKVTNNMGLPIAYASEDAARAGAALTDQQAAERLAQGNPKADAAPIHGGASGRSDTPRVVPDTSVPGTTHALVKSDGTVVGRLYTKGSPAWR